jgi:hypothetical protein
VNECYKFLRRRRNTHPPSIPSTLHTHNHTHAHIFLPLHTHKHPSSMHKYTYTHTYTPTIFKFSYGLNTRSKKCKGRRNTRANEWKEGSWIMEDTHTDKGRSYRSIPRQLATKHKCVLPASMPRHTAKALVSWRSLTCAVNGVPSSQHTVHTSCERMW